MDIGNDSTKRLHIIAGLFIAFAVAIVLNICPCGIEFDISKMR